jgi:3',5'-cyclic-nucleotide phosphodiesterase
METDLGIPSALFATPTRETVELGKSQLNFMNMFAIPLFQGVTDIMPAMQFTVDELHKNIKIWTTRIEEAQQRKDNSDDSVMDGMFSPRAMSLAFPSDAANQQGADRTGSISSKLGDLLSSGPHGSGPKKAVTLEGITESDFQGTGSKGLSNGPDEDPISEPNGAIEGEPLIPPVHSMARRSSKPTPSQLQLSYATISAPGLLDHPNQDADAHDLQKRNCVHVGHSLVTDAVFRDQQTPTPRPESKHHNVQRTSDTTDSNNSAPGSHDWASQATSATTSKIPLSPSTRGTSIMSNDSTERPIAVSPLTQPPSIPSPTRSNTTASQSCPTLPATSEHTIATTATDPGLSDAKNGSGVTIIETMRSLARKSSRSRFRMSFWRKKTGPAPGTGGVPPMPTALPMEADDEARGRSRGGEYTRGRSSGGESRDNDGAGS